MSVFGVIEFKKGTYYKLKPGDIELPDMGLQGRSGPPKRIPEMALSLIEEGQKQPIIVRKGDESRPVLVAGFRRRAGALALDTLRTDPMFIEQLSEEGKKRLALLGNEPFLLDAKVETLNDEQAFLANVAENNEREDLTPMDRLKIILTLRDRFGRSDLDIAKMFGKGPWFVFHHLKLGEMSPRIQRLTDEGVIKLQTVAMTLAKIGAVEREAVLDDIEREYREEMAAYMSVDTSVMPQVSEKDMKAMQRITAAAISDAVRARREKSGVTDHKGPKLRRTVAGFRKYALGMIENEPDDSPMKILFVDLMAWLDGEITERALTLRTKKHLGMMERAASGK